MRFRKVGPEIIVRVEPEKQKASFFRETYTEPDNPPLRASQLIGALVIRLVQFAQSGAYSSLDQFPDKHLINCILELCRNPKEMETNVMGILFHLTKILDDCDVYGSKKKALPPPEPAKAKGRLKNEYPGALRSLLCRSLQIPDPGSNQSNDQ